MMMMCYQVLPLDVRKFHPGSSALSSRFFATDRDVSQLPEKADVDPYCLVQKDLDTIASSIRKVSFWFIF